jgi:hypothetical protein
MNATLLLARLRGAGVSISSLRGGLIVEAPPGVVTAELRAELVRCKAELIAWLEKSQHDAHEDSIVTEARYEIAGLLAKAYRRFSATQRVSGDQPNSGNNGLANYPSSSVHGDVP